MLCRRGEHGAFPSDIVRHLQHSLLISARDTREKWHFGQFLLDGCFAFCRRGLVVWAKKGPKCSETQRLKIVCRTKSYKLHNAAI